MLRCPLTLLAVTWLALAPAAAFAGKLLVVRKDYDDFAMVKEGIQAEIRSAHQIVDFLVTDETKYETFAAKVREEKPDLLLLMDNISVALATRFNLESDDYAKKLKAVATMGLNLKKELKDSANLCGIAYEVPAFSIITQFRYLVVNPIKNVLVFYRKSEFAQTIEEAREQLARTGINLIALDAEAKGDSKDEIAKFLSDNLKEEVAGQKVDAVWVISDNGLLNEKTFGAIWVKRGRTFKIPFICGLEVFVSKKVNFCSYAAAPNHKDLGVQMATTALSILDEGQTPAQIGVEYILSVVKTVNLDKLHSLGLQIGPERMKDVKEAN